MTLAGRRVAVDLPHLAFVTAIGAWCAWFCWDAWLSEASVSNLIMILPASSVAVILYLCVAAGCFRVIEREEYAPSPRPALGEGVALKVAGAMALLAAFVVAGPLIGFDVASFAYIFAMLLFLGERRILVLLLVPALFCVVAIYCFDTILATPLPLLFFPADAS